VKEFSVDIFCKEKGEVLNEKNNECIFQDKPRYKE
jgi:hypothetical protein